MRLASACVLALLSSPALAEDMPGMNMGRMPGMSDMPGMAHTGVLGNYPMTREATGTAWQPDAASHHGIHFQAGDWLLMAHARFVGAYDTQSGPRGDDKTFLSGTILGTARRDFDNGDTLNLRAHFSIDPFM